MASPCSLPHRLVPIFQDTWMQPGVRDVLLPGMQIKARIYKVSQEGGRGRERAGAVHQ